MTMQEENLHAGGKWETMNFLGVASAKTSIFKPSQNILATWHAYRSSYRSVLHYKLPMQKRWLGEVGCDVPQLFL